MKKRKTMEKIVTAIIRTFRSDYEDDDLEILGIYENEEEARAAMKDYYDEEMQKFESLGDRLRLDADITAFLGDEADICGEDDDWKIHYELRPVNYTKYE